jgi:hypothetical protein
MKHNTYDPVTEKEYSHENGSDFKIQQFCELNQYDPHDDEVINFAFSLRQKLINDLESKDDTVRLKLIIWIEEKFLLVMKESMISNDISIPKNLIGFKAFKYKTKNIDADAIEGEKEDWDGTLYNLAYKIHTDYDNKVFPSADSYRDAYRIAANKYTYNNGKEVTMRSLEGAWDKYKDLFT